MACSIEVDVIPPGATGDELLCHIAAYTTYLEWVVNCNGVQTCCDKGYKAYLRTAAACSE